MKHAHVLHTSGWVGHEHDLGDWLSEQYAKLMAGFNRWSAERRNIRELESLSDFLLRDMGVERSQIRKFVRGSARRP